MGMTTTEKLLKLAERIEGLRVECKNRGWLKYHRVPVEPPLVHPSKGCPGWTLKPEAEAFVALVRHLTESGYQVRFWEDNVSVVRIENGWFRVKRTLVDAAYAAEFGGDDD